MAIILRLIILALFFLSTSAQAQWTDRGFNFRASAAFVTDGTNETYSRGQSDLYPQTRATATFGWNNFVDMERDTNAAIDRRLAGGCKYQNNAARQTWRLDLPSAGVYDISMAIGRDSNATTNWITVQDNTTDLFSISNVACTAGQFADANGTVHTTANWPANNTKRRVTFTSTTARVLLAQGGADANESAIAHMRFEYIGAGGGGLPLFLRAIGED